MITGNTQGPVYGKWMLMLRAVHIEQWPESHQESKLSGHGWAIRLKGLR